AGEVVADDLPAPVRPRDLRVLFRHRVRIKGRLGATNDVSDEALILAVTDAQGELVVAAGRGVSEGDVRELAPVWQLQRAAVVDGGINGRVVQERGDAGPEHRVVFRRSGLRIVLPRRVDLAR